MGQADFAIERIEPAQAEQALDDLNALLIDAVDDGASVGFLAPLQVEDAAGYWRKVFAEAGTGSLVILVARLSGRIVGSIQLMLASQPNGSHRAEPRRLLVHRSARRQGIGRALMLEMENVARSLGRTLLYFNTRAGDPPEQLYLRMGYQIVGRIPNFARNPDGTMNTTTILYRELE